MTEEERIERESQRLNARGEREKVRGKYRFSSLMKQKTGGGIALSFTSPEKEFCFMM
jgi:hypothetical protein